MGGVRPTAASVPDPKGSSCMEVAWEEDKGRTHTEFTSVYSSVLRTGCCQGSSHANQWNITIQTQRGISFNISWAGALICAGMEMQLDANRYTVYTTDIKISIVTFPLLWCCYEALQQATHNDLFFISPISLSVFTCLRVGAISSAAVWRWVRE